MKFRLEDMGDHVFRRRLSRTASNGDDLRTVFSPQRTSETVERLHRVGRLDHSNTGRNVHFPADENACSSSVNGITNVVVPIPRLAPKSNKQSTFVGTLATDHRLGETVRSMLSHPSASSLQHVSQLKQLLPPQCEQDQCEQDYSRSKKLSKCCLGSSTVCTIDSHIQISLRVLLRNLIVSAGGLAWTHKRSMTIR